MNSNSISLKAENLCKSFDGFKAVENLSLEIESGEIFGLLGPNGAGKTTSIKMITGLLKPDSGRVEFFDRTNNHLNNSQKVGLCPQEIVLWNNLTCLEQLVFIAEMYDVPTQVARKRAENLLEKIGLLEKRKKLVKTLSGGMQRRMNLIMALMHDPEILILDEPEAGLDPQSRVMVRDFIYSLSKTKTVIFTTHNMDEADRLCDRIAILDHGKILVSDSPENLKRKIGISDKLEILFTGQAPQLTDVSGLADEVELKESSVLFKSKAIIDKIPLILESLKTMNITITGMNLSENTLEDVFISLTGRKLRE
ncbi:MAG: ABC transporter ATP-binding protein [Bacteroidetes bacterium]|nr:ABC transporter ATP-binding protein [Bacteroidota bacterium]